MMQDQDVTINSTLTKKTSPAWVEKFTKYVKDNFTKRNTLWRLLWFVVGCVVVLVPSLTCNLLFRAHNLPWITNYDSAQYHNSGISFGTDMPPALIYFLQSVICLILLGVLLFMKKWYFVIPLALAFTGGAFNLFDRAAGFSNWPNTVIDYISTDWFFHTVSNFPDFFIVGGVVIFALLYIIFAIVGATGKNNKTEGDHDEQNHGQQPQ